MSERGRNTDRNTRGERMDRTAATGRETSGRTRRHTYQERTAEQYQNRRPRGRKDNWLKSEYTEYFPKEENHARILPPLGMELRHWGMELYIHYNVGYDNRQYLCLEKMLGERCPVCEEYRRLLDLGKQDAASKIKPGFYWGTWVWDKKDLKHNAPKFWKLWASLDENIVSLSKDKRTGRYLPIDHPDKGFDVFFEVYKENGYPKTKGVQIDRDSSPVPEDFLVFVEDNPLSSALVYFDYEYIKDVLMGKDMDKVDSVDQGVDGTANYTYNEVMALTPDKLEEICLDVIKIPKAETDRLSDEQLRDEVLKHFELYPNDQNLRGRTAE